MKNWKLISNQKSARWPIFSEVLSKKETKSYKSKINWYQCVTQIFQNTHCAGIQQHDLAKGTRTDEQAIN